MWFYGFHLKISSQSNCCFSEGNLSFPLWQLLFWLCPGTLLFMNSVWRLQYFMTPWFGIFRQFWKAVSLSMLNIASDPLLCLPLGLQLPLLQTSYYILNIPYSLVIFCTVISTFLSMLISLPPICQFTNPPFNYVWPAFKPVHWILNFSCCIFGSEIPIYLFLFPSSLTKLL